MTFLLNQQHGRLSQSTESLSFGLSFIVTIVSFRVILENVLPEGFSSMSLIHPQSSAFSLCLHLMVGVNLFFQGQKFVAYYLVSSKLTIAVRVGFSVVLLRPHS